MTGGRRSSKTPPPLELEPGHPFRSESETREDPESKVSPKSRRLGALIAVLIAVAVLILIRTEQAGPPSAPAAAPGFPDAALAPSQAPGPTPPAQVEAAEAAAPNDTPDNRKTGEEGALSPSRTAVRLYGNARVRPLYDRYGNALEGVEISQVSPGSFWQELGIDDGDVILELNGKLIDSPAATVELMNQFSRGYVLNLRIRTREGVERFIDYRTPARP